MNNRAFQLGPALAATLALLIGLAVVVGFSWRAGMVVDARALTRQSEYANRGFTELYQKIPRDQESITDWDEAVLRAGQADTSWMADNIGEWMATYFGHDRAYVLNAQDRPIYAMVDGETVATGQYDKVVAQIGPRATALRVGLREADGEVTGIEFLDTIEGHPAIVSLKPIEPSSERVTVAPGSEYIHVAVQYLEGQVLADISRRFNLRNLQLSFERQPHLPAIPLADPGGPTFAWLQWTANRPGSETVLDQMPMMIAGLVLTGLVLWLLWSRLRRSIRQLADSNARALFLADHDRLTGLPNRSQFVEAVHLAVQQAASSNLQVAVVALDLDDFSAVNDAHGTLAGDDFIRALAERARASLKVGELIARVGGDEFAAVKSMANATELDEFVPRLVRAFASPVQIEGRPAVHATVSAGIAIYPSDSPDPAKLIANADLALGRASSMGPGTVCLFDATYDEVARRRRELAKDIAGALTRGEFYVAYQVQQAVKDGRVAGYEALLRWQHPRHGLVPPSEFIVAAEQSGQMPMLGSWVLRTACREVMAADLPGRIAVNLSPWQLSDPGLVETVSDALLEAGMPAARLELEVTETALIADKADSLDKLRQLQAMGIAIALDDFGTGYSSLETVRSFKWDKIKIDRSFMAEIDSSEEAKAIMRAVIALGKALHTPVLAEGVETSGQLDALMRQSCDLAQGYLLGRPVPISEVTPPGARERAA